MSEIPIGSPPAPPGRHAAPPGWYSDPVDRSQERYWDGWQWSRTTRKAELPAHPGQGQAEGWSGGDHGRPQNGYGHNGYGQNGHSQNGHGQNGGSLQWGGSAPGSYPGQSGGGFATSAPGSQQMLTADGVPMAAWGFRAIAALIDLILVGVVTMAVSTPFYAPMWNYVLNNIQQGVQAAQRGLPAPPSPTVAELNALLTTTDRFMIGLIAAAIGMTYYVLMWRLRSATLGQLIFGLRVVPVDHAQQTPKISWSSAIIRAIIWVIPRLTLFLLVFWALNCLFPLWNAKRQALHDLAARTQVVKIR